MPWNVMNNEFVHGTRRCVILVGFSVVAGCSWKAPVPADYVPDEGPTEPWIIATPNPVPAGRGPGKTIVNWHTGDGVARPGLRLDRRRAGTVVLVQPLSPGSHHRQQARV